MKQVTIYTDGGCEGNPGPGGWAAVLLSGPHRKEVSGGAAATTNNRMELQAAIGALGALKELNDHIRTLGAGTPNVSVADAYDHFLGHGASVEQEPTETDYGAIAMLADPLGNGFCLLQFGERGYEALAEGVEPRPAGAPSEDWR